jgi:hypothetical protein
MLSRQTNSLCSKIICLALSGNEQMRNTFFQTRNKSAKSLQKGLKGIVRQKLRWVKSGINSWLFVYRFYLYLKGH